MKLRAKARVVALLGLVAAGAGCSLFGDPVMTMSRAVGMSGWFHVSLADVEHGGVTEDTAATYDRRFAALPLGVNAPPCATLEAMVTWPERPVVVLVPGIQGDGAEWRSVIPDLARAQPAAMFMFRWVPFDERDPLVERLAAGVSRILECIGRRTSGVVVLAHSAGGVIASFAASRIALSSASADRRVAIVTVASPLAGTVDRAGNADGTGEAKFILDLGTAITSYPDPAVGVAALHLRTSYPADRVMRPDKDGRVPNQRGVGIPGAREIDLPAILDHTQALLYAAEELATGGLDVQLAFAPCQEGACGP